MEKKLENIIEYFSQKKETLLNELSQVHQIEFSNEFGDKIIAINYLLRYFNELKNVSPDSLQDTALEDMDHAIATLMVRHNLTTAIAMKEKIKWLFFLIKKSNISDSILNVINKTNNI